MAPQRSRAAEALWVALAHVVVAQMFFASMDACAKYLAAHQPVVLLAWARYATHATLMLLLLPWLGRRMLRTRRPWLQGLRSAALCGTTVCGMLALSRLPLAEATALFFLSPLVVTLLAGPVLGERVGLRAVVAVALGFAGVLAIARPGGEANAEGLLAILGAAACFTVYQLATRVAAQSEHPVASLFFSALLGAGVLSVPLPWVLPAVWPPAAQIVGMVLLGVLGGCGHFLLIRAYARAPAASLAPALYGQLVWAVLLGFLVFGQLPDLWSALGAGLIVLGGWLVATDRSRHGRAVPAVPADR